MNNAFRENDNNFVTEKINNILNHYKPKLDYGTRLKYDRNIQVLHNYEDFDFRSITSKENIEIRNKFGKRSVIELHGLDIKVETHNIYTFEDNNLPCVGSVFFAAKIKGYKTIELGIFAEAIYNYLNINYADKYTVQPSYIKVIDVMTQEIIDYQMIFRWKTTSTSNHFDRGNQGFSKTIIKLKTIKTFNMRTLQSIADEIEIWEGWRDNYRDFVPAFIEEAKTGKHWKDWDADVFWEYFEKSNDQCVSSLRLGYFTSEEKRDLKIQWYEIAPLLQKIALSQEEPLFETYYELKSIIRKYTRQNRKASTNRLIAGLQPNLLCTIVNEDNLKVFIKKLNENVMNCNIPITGDWFRNSNAVWRFFLENLKSISIYTNITLPWQMYEYFINDDNKTNDMSEIPENRKSIIKLLQYKNQIVLQGPPGTGKTREAKLIAESILGLDEKELQKSEQFKIIQFHPSYTYEDFVRGIVAKPNDDGEGVLYEAENKTLGRFAEDAKKNFKAVQQSQQNVDDDEYIFEQFRNHIISKLAEDEKFELTNNIYIFDIDDNRFKYKGDNWKRHPKGLSIRYSEFKKVIAIRPSNRQEIVKNASLESLTRSHATYFFELFTKYKEFYASNRDELNNRETYKNHILIIDEINRANLSSVLGELIYALEYRGEEVESMYEVDGSQKLILPPNLYIIGTMNTADRSVGHIDYAIRRRFAFVDILPKDITAEMKAGEFYTDLFSAVKALFTKDEYQTKSDFISHEFEPKDVALGHSYFIDKTSEGGGITVRWNYEIKPILLEYIRDGVLKVDALKQINEIENKFSLAN